MTLSTRIKREMVVRITKKMKMRKEIYSEIRGQFATDEDFDKSFEKAWRKLK